MLAGPSSTSTESDTDRRQRCGDGPKGRRGRGGPAASGTDRPSASAFPCRAPAIRAAGAIFGSVQVPGAVGTQLAAVVAEMTGLNTWIENDTGHWRSPSTGSDAAGYIDTFAAVQTGDGLGAGLLLDGVIHRGRNGAAGEIGHTAVVIGGVRCACGKRGCWETVATLRWLRRTARSRGMRGAPDPRRRTPRGLGGRRRCGRRRPRGGVRRTPGDRTRQPRPDPRHRAHHPPR